MAKGKKKIGAEKPKRAPYATGAPLPPELAEMLKSMGIDAAEGFAFGNIAVAFLMKVIADLQATTERRHEEILIRIDRMIENYEAVHALHGPSVTLGGSPYPTPGAEPAPQTKEEKEPS